MGTIYKGLYSSTCLQKSGPEPTTHNPDYHKNVPSVAARQAEVARGYLKRAARISELNGHTRRAPTADRREEARSEKLGARARCLKSLLSELRKGGFGERTTKILQFVAIDLKRIGAK